MRCEKSCMDGEENMKDFIALCAVVVLLLTFPVQYALNIRNHYEMALVQKYVSNAKEHSKLEGCFTDSIVEDMKKAIVDGTSIREDEIQFASENMNVRVERGQIIHYSISVPIHKLIAVEALWGIREDDNKGLYRLENTIVSEWIEK